MTATREEIDLALLALISTAADFQTISRKWEDWQGTPINSNGAAEIPEMPCLFQYKSNETTEYKGARGQPKIRIWKYWLMVYVKITPGDTPGIPGNLAGASMLNPLLDAIEAVLTPDPLDDGLITLGGLVQDVRIEGETIIELGDHDPSGLCAAVIPVAILVQ